MPWNLAWCLPALKPFILTTFYESIIKNMQISSLIMQMSYFMHIKYYISHQMFNDNHTTITCFVSFTYGLNTEGKFTVTFDHLYFLPNTVLNMYDLWPGPQCFSEVPWWNLDDLSKFCFVAGGLGNWYQVMKRGRNLQPNEQIRRFHILPLTYRYVYGWTLISKWDWGPYIFTIYFCSTKQVELSHKAYLMQVDATNDSF